jgi:phosphoglycerol transferase
MKKAAAPVDGRKAVAVYAVAVLLCLIILIWLLKLWQVDLRAPLAYYGEANYNALLVKTTIENGWHLDNSAMGAPDGLNLRDVPMGDNNLHFVLIKLIGLITRNYGLTINLFFLLGFLLTTVSALFVLRRFGVSSTPAIFASLLFTFLPFHFTRGLHHLFLAAYFLVPLMVLVALWVAMGAVSVVDEASGKIRQVFGDCPIFRDKKLIASVVICLLMSAGGTYFAYFGCFFLLIAGVLIALRRKNLRFLILPAAMIALIFGGLVVNLAPSILHVRREGDTPIVRRQPIDAEIYSFRISQLVLPISGHRAPLFAKLKAAFNQRQFINENDDAAFGVVGTIGFLILIGWLLLKKPELWRIEEDGGGGVISHLSVFNLAAVFLGAFGGVGALIALVLTAKIRAYNRISVYIAFFSLMTIALLLDRFAQRYVRTKGARLAFNLCLALALALGAADQFAPRLRADYGQIKTEFDSDADFIGRMQSSLPSGAMIFQLPVVPFPENPRVAKMFDYDHARGYLHSRTLRWSYGAMKGRASEVWQKMIAAKPANEMIESIVLSGFQGLYLNRNGYDQNPSAPETEIATVVGAPRLVSRDGKLIFFDLREFEKGLREKYAGNWDVKREEALHPLLVVWGEGCSDLEGPPDRIFRWCSAIGELQITNGAQRPRKVRIEMAFATENEANLWIESPLLTERLSVSAKPTSISRSIAIPPGSHSIHFRSDARRVLEPGDFRYLVFKISGFKITPEG